MSDANPFRVGDRFRCGSGRNQLEAEVVGLDGRTVLLERWNPRARQPRRTGFRLAAWFLRSPNCGWKRATP